MLRWLTAGESHGPELVAILEGLPAGVPISPAQIQADMQRRKLGYGRGARMKFEEDELSISGGIRFGLTMGSPVALRIGNTEWPRWVEVMSPEPVDAETLPKGRGAPLTRPRPGHADLVGMQKYGFDEARNVLERASARETAARVALGAVARAFLGELGIRLVAHTLVHRDRARARGRPLPTPDDVEALDADPLRCFDAETSAAMVARIDKAHDDGDTLGGVVEVLAYGVPPGLGSYTHWDRRLDGQLAGALMGIQAIKGVEVGDGFLTTTRPGSAGARRARPRRRADHPAQRQGGRHRGRHVDGHGAARPGRHEADRDRAPRAAHGRRRDRGGIRRAPPALRRLRGPRRRRRRRGDGRPRARRTPCSRSSAATRWPRRKRNLDAYLASIPATLRTASASTPALDVGLSPPALPVVLDRPDGRRARPGSASGSRACSARASPTPTRRSSPSTARSPICSPSTASRTSASSSARPSRRPWRPTTSSRSAAGRCSTRRPRRTCAASASCS